jgi:ABC-type transporter Mla MlaB component
LENIAPANRLTIKLSGQLDVDCLAELEAQIASGVRRIELEMKEVTLVDIDAVRFLLKCQTRGIRLRGRSAYISDWMRREQDSGTEE